MIRISKKKLEISNYSQKWKKSEKFEQKSKVVNALLLRRKTRKPPQTPEGRQSWPNSYERRLESPPGRVLWASVKVELL